MPSQGMIHVKTVKFGQRSKAAVATAASALLFAVAGCSGAESASTLTWYMNPDGGGSDPEGGGQAQIAAECTKAANGKYSIDIQQLPNSASDQRQQLLRRLAAGDSSMNIMSLDPVFVAEFADAGFLAPIPQGKTDAFTADTVQGSITSSTWDGKLVAVPFWANTQLLWYRKSVAKEAGLDMSQPVTWEQVIEAAKKQDKLIGVQASLYEGYTVWINALIAGAGGEIVENPEAPAKQLQLGVDSAAGRDAAKIIGTIAKDGLAGPAMSSTDETTALNTFSNDDTSGFLVNWPYVWSAFPANKVKFIDDIGWARYPQTVPGQASKPPLGGINLGVGAKTENPELAYEAVECISSEANQKLYMLGTGNPAAKKAVYEDAEVKKAFPMAELIRSSLDDAAPRPQSPFYGEVSTGLQTAFSPPSAVNPDTTPGEAAKLITAVVKGEKLL